MRDARTLAALRMVSTAQDMERLVAERALADCKAAEQRLSNRLQECEADAQAAHADWVACISGRGFDPARLGALASQLDVIRAEIDRISQALAKARQQTQDASRTLAACRARESRLDERQLKLRRRVQMKREERRMTNAEDMITRAWVDR